MTMLGGIIFLRGKLEAIGLRFPPKGTKWCNGVWMVN